MVRLFIVHYTIQCNHYSLDTVHLTLNMASYTLRFNYLLSIVTIIISLWSPLPKSRSDLVSTIAISMGSFFWGGEGCRWRGGGGGGRGGGVGGLRKKDPGSQDPGFLHVCHQCFHTNPTLFRSPNLIIIFNF